MRFKARLVAKGFTQVAGVDFTETFAPVANPTSLRVLIALAAHFDWELHQMDVETAFLNAELEEEIYLQLPPPLSTKSNPTFCRLAKTIYGLKQSPMRWNQTAHEALLDLGFTQCQKDTCVYIRIADTITIIALYVDDFVIASSTLTSMAQIKGELSRKFTMSDLGELKHLLGQRITRDRRSRTILLDQEAYTKRVLATFQMDQCKPTTTPAETAPLTKPTEGEHPTQFPFKSIVGSIVYAATKTRPDLAYATSRVCQFNSNATDRHWIAAKRILRYLQNTTSHGIGFKGSSEPPTLVGYADSDFAGDTDDRRSTTGFIFMLCGGPVSWMSKKQSTVALSSTEAEYMAACEAAREAIFIRALLAELQLEQATATTIFEDNQGCIALTKNPVHHSRTKHIDVRHHFVRTKVESGEVAFHYIPTTDMVADIFTKPLAKPLFLQHAGAFMTLRH